MCNPDEAVEDAKQNEDCEPDTTKDCEDPIVHALLDVNEITFHSNHVVEKDTQGNFAAPEWKKGRSDSDNSPVCYTRNKKVKLTAKFAVTRQPTSSESVEVKGTGQFGAKTLNWTGNVTVSPGDTEVTVSNLESDTELPNEVACFDTAEITWTANPAGTGWTSAGKSKHLMYVVLDDPSGTPVYWTLIDISCRAAAGETTENGVVTKAYAPFQTRKLTRKRDDHDLTYWNPRSTRATNTQQLLASSDGSGQCGSWAEFLIDMYKCHGITTVDKVLVVRSKTEWTSSTAGFLVKNWDFKGTGSSSPPWTHEMYTECENKPGIPGQRSPEPPPAFFNHFIVIHGSNFYDPSYGGGPVTSQSAWENGAIEGLFTKTVSPTRTGFPKSSHSTTNLLEFWNLRTGAKI